MKNIFKSLLQKSSKIPESQTFYEKLHGETGIKELVELFYTIMESDPKASNVLLTHPMDNGKIPTPIKEKLFMFLSGWLGGPNLFIEQVGPPMMRKRHLHIKIRNIEKEEWIYCMTKAIAGVSFKVSKKDKKSFINSSTALGMRIQNC